MIQNQNEPTIEHADVVSLPDRPDFYTEEEFQAATPERRAAAVAMARVEFMTRRYHDAMVKLVTTAAQLGLQIEARTVSNWPPAMGNVSTEIEVRPRLALIRDLERLEADAKLSELAGEERAAARGDHVHGTDPQ